MALLFGKRYTRGELLARMGRMHQIGGIQISRLQEGKGDGVRQAIFRTGSGLEGSILIDRAMDLWNVQYKGIPLGWISPSGAVHPSYYEWEGQGWERGWQGGLLTTCGLDQYGRANEDQGMQLYQHGRVSHLPAEMVQVQEEWNGDDYVCRIHGEVHQTAPMKEYLILHRTIKFSLGSNTIQLHDSVENRGFRKEPHMMLYHINTGFPLLSKETELVTSPKKVTPCSDAAQKEPDGFENYDVPQPDYDGREYSIDFFPDESGTVSLALINKSIENGVGLYVKYNKKSLPFFNMWKMIGKGTYTVAVEPMNRPFYENGIVLDRADVRKKGLLQFLEPGEQREYHLELGILDGKEEIDKFRKSVQYTSY